MKKLSNIQKRVLLSMAINGPAHIQAIQIKEGLNYASCHRAIKRLEELELVWMSERDETRGPKAAREYSLTPYGVVEAVLRCGADKHIPKLLKNWMHYSPRYIRYWETFEKNGLLIDIKQRLERIYPDCVSPKSYDNNYDIKNREITYHNQICVFTRNILDLNFLGEIFNPSEKTLDYEKEIKLIEIISKDTGYLEVWKRWFSVQKLIFNHLTELNEKIIELHKNMKINT